MDTATMYYRGNPLRTQVDIKEVEKLLKEGLGFTAIGRKIGVSHNSVRRHFEQHFGAEAYKAAVARPEKSESKTATKKATATKTATATRKAATSTRKATATKAATSTRKTATRKAATAAKKTAATKKAA